MKNDEENSELIRHFLSGVMGDEELGRLRSRLREDADLRRALDREAGFDALVQDAVDSPMADIRYEALVDKATSPRERHAVKKAPRSWLTWYAAAATIVLMVLGGRILISSHRPRTSADVSVAAQPGQSLIPENGKSITRLATGAFVVAEEGTRARVLQKTDSVITVAVAQGNAYFDVSGEKGPRVMVVTPHSAMTVHGTAFRLVVTELETDVTVLEGSVEIAHRKDLDSPHVLAAGATGFADLHSFQTAESLPLSMCERQKSLLRSYVGWVRQQAHG